jgi:Resolvase, N terminal domain
MLASAPQIRTLIFKISGGRPPVAKSSGQKPDRMHPERAAPNWNHHAVSACGRQAGGLRLDRLDRSTRDVLNLVHELNENGASLRVLEPEVTTAGSMGRIVITILGMVADMELKFIKEPTKIR